MNYYLKDYIEEGSIVKTTVDGVITFAQKIVVITAIAGNQYEGFVNRDYCDVILNEKESLENLLEHEKQVAIDFVAVKYPST